MKSPIIRNPALLFDEKCNVLKIKLRRFNWNLASLAVPGLIFLFAFYILPFIMGFLLPFKNFNARLGLFKSPFVGLKNFEFLFTSQNILKVIRNTVSLNLLFIISTLIVSIFIALLLFEVRKKSVKFFQSVFFLPYFISWVIASYILYAFLNADLGILNRLFKLDIIWYANANYWPVILSIAYIWKNAGYFSLIYYTGLLAIDPVYYEAASIDGASKLCQIRRITLPLLNPLIVLLLLLQLGRIFFSDFGLFFFLTRNQGLLYATTDVMDTFIYRSLRVMGNIGMSAAAGFMQAIIGFVLILTVNLVIRKTRKDYALF